MVPVNDPYQLQMRCNWINDMIAGECDIVATPGDKIIAWQRKFEGKGQYPVDQAEAYYRLKKAGYNPKALVEFACK